MAVTLNASTKILELAKEFPFLFETLVEISPKLKRLQNPILQKTIGRRATLTDVSKLSKEAEEKTGWQEELDRRQRKLKDLVLGLHAGEELEGLQSDFKEILVDVNSRSSLLVNSLQNK